jgi:AraC-like DNA-binding protein
MKSRACSRVWGLPQWLDMPGSITSMFSEPEDFEAVLREEGVLGVLINGRGRFQAQLTQIALHSMRLVAAEEQLSRIAFVAVPADAVLVPLPTGRRPSPIWGGIGMQADEIVTLGPDQRVHTRTDGPCRWGTIRLPADDLARYGRALTGTGFAVPRTVERWRLAPAGHRDLLDLHRAAIRAGEARAKALIDAKAVYGLEQQLIHAVVECLSQGPVNEEMSAHRHRDILARFEGLLQMWPLLRVGKISATLKVSNRTLRSLCEEHLGMGPSSYLRLHRVQQMHRALRKGKPDGTTVAEAARRCAVRHLGRFAASYRALYGELPSATLRRGADGA